MRYNSQETSITTCVSLPSRLLSASLSQCVEGLRDWLQQTPASPVGQKELPREGLPAAEVVPERVTVTRVFMPPQEDYAAYLKHIWQVGQVTNMGPLVQALQTRLCETLGVPRMRYVGNGTLALQVALKALGVKRKVITTPFSYVATTSSLVWEGLEPVFADICPETLTLDPESVSRMMTPDVDAIVATHVYGNPCDVEALAAIGARYGIPVVYDAAHAYGVMYQGQSLLNYGDVSTLSFHATKVFHTIEGGGIICQDPEVDARVAYLMNFGHAGPEAFHGVGINAKNSEFHAAMGLSILPYWERIQSERQFASSYYDACLADLPGVSRPTRRAGSTENYAYYPIIFEDEVTLLSVERVLTADNIIPRRYFYPCLSQLPYVAPASVPVAESVSRRVLCLPLYAGMTPDVLERITTRLRQVLLTTTASSSRRIGKI